MYKCIVNNNTENIEAPIMLISLKYTQNWLKYITTVTRAALHTVTFVDGCFMGKCILTGFTE